MAVYYSSKCPHCNQVQERRKDDPRPYGSPFKKCRSCGREFVDTSYVEPGLLDLEEHKMRAFSWGAPILIVLGVVILVVSFPEKYTLGIVFGLGMIAFGTLSLISSLKWKPAEDTSFMSMVEESKKRLADPYYVIALQKNGCYVTPEITKWAKNEIGSNSNEHHILAKSINTESNI